MAISTRFLINKSNSVVTVYKDISGSATVGQLLKREAYAMYGYEGDIISIKFLGPNGGLISGFLRNPPSGTVTSCTNYPYGTLNKDGKIYYTFYMRSSKQVYTQTNTGKQLNHWGSVAAGRRVACLTDAACQDKLEYKAINYVESTSGQWVKVDNYGYVDTGLASSSSYSGIAMYGNW
ncbi:MAG: hypothetical protein IJ141_02545 [Lachnospiraceae bacterium]|nr:hypothetical protein [Lachnospiraceae bacterium]